MKSQIKRFWIKRGCPRACPEPVEGLREANLVFWRPNRTTRWPIQAVFRLEWDEPTPSRKKTLKGHGLQPCHNQWNQKRPSTGQGPAISPKLHHSSNCHLDRSAAKAKRSAVIGILAGGEETMSLPQDASKGHGLQPCHNQCNQERLQPLRHLHTLPNSTTPKIVISTGAQRSGEICGDRNSGGGPSFRTLRRDGKNNVTPARNLKGHGLQPCHNQGNQERLQPLRVGSDSRSLSPGTHAARTKSIGTY